MEKRNNLFVPYVVEQMASGTRTSDIFSRLLEDRIIILNGEVNDESCNLIMSQLLYLNSLDNSKPIMLYINSEGGSVISGLGQVIDVMNYISSPVYTIATGMAASMGAAILSAGEPGHRYCMKSSHILVHPMSGGAQGRTRDNSIDINFEKRLQNYLFALIGKNCGKLTEQQFKEVEVAVSEMTDKDEYPTLKLSKDTEKALAKFKDENDYDHWMFPSEAVKFGIVDKILEKESDL